MTRYFLILAFFLFFAPSGQAQTTVPDPVAAWFLERNEEHKVLDHDIQTLKLEIINLTTQRDDKAKLADSRAKDVISYEGKILEKQIQLDLKQSDIKRLEREVRRQKFAKMISWIAAGVIILATIIYG